MTGGISAGFRWRCIRILRLRPFLFTMVIPVGWDLLPVDLVHAATWVIATMEAIENCGCPDGGPSCVQSPKCGNRNSPLDKAGAVLVLRFVAEALTRAVSVPPEMQQ